MPLSILVTEEKGICKWMCSSACLKGQSVKKIWVAKNIPISAMFLYIKIKHRMLFFTAREHLSWVLLRSLSTWRENEASPKVYLNSKNLRWIFVMFLGYFFKKQNKAKQQKDHNYLKPNTFCVISLLEKHFQGKMLIAAFIWQLVELGKVTKLVLPSWQKVLYCKVSSFLSMVGFPAFLQCQKY